MFWLLTGFIFMVGSFKFCSLEIDSKVLARVDMIFALLVLDTLSRSSFGGFSLLGSLACVLILQRLSLAGGLVWWLCDQRFKQLMMSCLQVPMWPSTMVAKAVLPRRLRTFLILSEARISESALRRMYLSFWGRSSLSPMSWKLVLTKRSKSSQRWLMALSLKLLMMRSERKTKPISKSLMYLMYMLRSIFSQSCFFFSKDSPSSCIILRRQSKTTRSFFKTLQRVCFCFCSYKISSLLGLWGDSSFLVISRIIQSRVLLRLFCGRESKEVATSLRSVSELILDSVRTLYLLKQSFKHLRMRQISSNWSCFQSSLRQSSIWVYFAIPQQRVQSMKRRVFYRPIAPPVMRLRTQARVMGLVGSCFFSCQKYSFACSFFISIIILFWSLTEIRLAGSSPRQSLWFAWLAVRGWAGAVLIVQIV